MVWHVQERVGIFYLHAPDHNTTLDETLPAVQAAFEAGKFAELGLSNFVGALPTSVCWLSGHPASTPRQTAGVD